MKHGKLIKGSLLTLATTLLVACGNGNSDNTVSIGVVGDATAEVWEDVATRLEENSDIDLDVMTFTDYVQPNMALTEGELDLNAFQHSAFLSDYVIDSGDDIVPMGYTFISPSLVFATEKISDVESIPDGVTVAIPNSPTVANRAYLAMETMGLIELDDAAGFAPTGDDITKNLKDIEILEMEASQVPRALGDADLVIVGSDFAVDAGFDLEEAIFNDTEHMETIDPSKKNIVASTRENADNEVLQQVVAEYQSQATANKLAEMSQGTNIPAWQENDAPVEDFDALLESKQ